MKWGSLPFYVGLLTVQSELATRFLQNKTELDSVINLILTLISLFHSREDSSLSIVFVL